MFFSIISYLKYRFKRKSAAHSAFVYDFIVSVLKDKTKEPFWNKIEEERELLMQNDTSIHVLDLGVNGRKNGMVSTQKISTITKRACKSAKIGQLLYKIAKKYQAQNIVEFGTSMGMSTAYLATANPQAKLFTIEGCPEIAKQAGNVFDHLKLKNIEQVNAEFSYAINHFADQFRDLDLFFVDGNHDYQPTMDYFHFAKQHAKPSTIFIFDDIHWSTAMQKAWNDIKADSQVSITIDLFYIGIVFFRGGIAKQDFVL